MENKDDLEQGLIMTKNMLIEMIWAFVILGMDNLLYVSEAKLINIKEIVRCNRYHFFCRLIGLNDSNCNYLKGLTQKCTAALQLPQSQQKKKKKRVTLIFLSASSVWKISKALSELHSLKNMNGP